VTALPATSEPTAEADQDLHRQVCLTARPGESWTDRCACGELRIRHHDASHKPVATGGGRTCSGRNLAGACRAADCGCTRFTLPPGLTEADR
jgi:hypothetical protein